MRRNNPLLEQCPDGVVHELHALRFSGNDYVLEFLCGPFANDRGYCGIGDQDFVYRDAPRPVRAFQQQLCHDAAQRVGQHGAGLWLAIGGKHIHHAIDRFTRVIGMQRAKDQQTCLRGGKRERDGLQIPHFAHQNDIGIFAQGGFKPGCERDRIGGHFPLGDGAAFVVVHKFDRFLDGHHVF